MSQPRFAAHDNYVAAPVSMALDPIRLADMDDCAHYLECLNRVARVVTPNGARPPRRVCSDDCQRYAQTRTHVL